MTTKKDEQPELKGSEWRGAQYRRQGLLRPLDPLDVRNHAKQHR